MRFRRRPGDWRSGKAMWQGRALWMLALLGVFTAGAGGCTAANAGPPPRLTRIAIVGDSISQGASASRGTRTYAHRLGVLRPDLIVSNVSRWGWKASAPDRAHFSGAAFLATNMVLVAIGTNDYGAATPLDRFRADYRSAIRTVRLTEEVRVYCLTPLWRALDGLPNSAGALLDDYRQIIREECAASPNCAVVEGLDAVPVGNRYFPDGLHPGDSGHRKLADHLSRQIR